MRIKGARGRRAESQGMRVQVVINLNATQAGELDSVAASLGFGSRAAYVMHLHNAFKTSVSLKRSERNVLRHLGEWGYSNFRSKTPDIAWLARTMMVDETWLRKTIISLGQLGLIAEVEDREGPFQGDVRMGRGKRQQLTRAGMVAARAAAHLDAAEVEQLISEGKLKLVGVPQL